MVRFGETELLSCNSVLVGESSPNNVSMPSVYVKVSYIIPFTFIACTIGLLSPSRWTVET